MKASNFIWSLIVLGVVLTAPAAEATEKTFTPVALYGQFAPGTGTNIKFGVDFQCVSLADNGQLAFTSDIYGPGVTTTNNYGIWAGTPGSLNLVVRTGDTVPIFGSNYVLTLLRFPNIDDQGYVGFLGRVTNTAAPAIAAKSDGPSKSADSFNSVKFGSFVHDAFQGKARCVLPAVLLSGSSEPTLFELLTFPNYFSPESGEPSGHVINSFGSSAVVFDPDTLAEIGTAIVAGNPTNIQLVAYTTGPAPGTTNKFADVEEGFSILEDKRVAFTAYLDGSYQRGLWFGLPEDIRPVIIPSTTLPISLLGTGYLYEQVRQPYVDANANGELAFVVTINGPGVNSTNNQLLIAGPTNAFRVIARSGEIAAGVSMKYQDFELAVLGSDGRIAFRAFTSEADDEGIWMASPGGAPKLLAHTGQPAPGTSPGTLFEALGQGPFLNRVGQAMFLASLTGPDVGTTNRIGLWLAQPDGTVELVVRQGDTIEVSGTNRVLALVNLAAPNFLGAAGAEDGRFSPFNDRSEIAFEADWNSPTFVHGILLTRVGLTITAEHSGTNVLIRFPTLAGRHYRLDGATNLPVQSWNELISSVDGTGVNVTITNGMTAAQQFYRVVRTD